MGETAANTLFQLCAKVRPGPGCKMPPHLIGAFVECFAAAPDHMAALQLTVNKLVGQGFVFEDLRDGQVHQLDPLRWDGYVASAWPEMPDYFPPQADIIRFVRAGGVFFGPFCGWESDAEPNAAADGGGM